MTQYAVVQDKFETIPFEQLKDILIEHGGMVLADATRAARKTRGILTERLTIQQAAGVCHALQQFNYSVRALPTDKLPMLKKARQARWLEFHDDHLALPRGTTGVVEQVLWPNVFVINAGQVAETKVRDKYVFDSDTTEPALAAESETQKYSEYIHVAELIALPTNGHLMHIRLPAMGMNYARVLGPDLVDQGFFNKYLAMLDHLVARSSGALVSPETHELLKERKQHYHTREGDFYEAGEERKFSQYTRWLLQMVLFRESALPESSDSESTM